LRLPRR